MSVIEIDLNTDIAEIHRPTRTTTLSVLIRGKNRILTQYSDSPSSVDVIFVMDGIFVVRCRCNVIGRRLSFLFNMTDLHTQREDIIHRLIQSTSLAMTWGQYE